MQKDYFKGHKTDLTWESEPFENYLLIQMDGELRAYDLVDHAPLNVDELLAAVFEDFAVTTERECGQSNYAAIITDNRPCNSVIVWASCNFWLEEPI